MRRMSDAEYAEKLAAYIANNNRPKVVKLSSTEASTKAKVLANATGKYRSWLKWRDTPKNKREKCPRSGYKQRCYLRGLRSILGLADNHAIRAMKKLGIIEGEMEPTRQLSDREKLELLIAYVKGRKLELANTSATYHQTNMEGI